MIAGIGDGLSCQLPVVSCQSEARRQKSEVSTQNPEISTQNSEVDGNVVEFDEHRGECYSYTSLRFAMVITNTATD
jgi:hypothetical protein